MLQDVFNSIERPFHSAVIYMGTLITSILTWFNPIMVDGIKDVLAICVALTTLAYAILGVVLRIKALRKIDRNKNG